jgi:hypothetical protein
VPARLDRVSLARLRLVAHGLVEQAADPVDAVRRLLAVQAQEALAPLAAVALRTTGGPGRAEIEAALADGRLVRTWSQRGTLHLVAPEDVPWLLALTGPRMAAAARAVRVREGVTDAEVARAAEAVHELVPVEGLRRPDLLAALAARGFEVGGNRGYHLLVALATSGAVVIGARDTQYRFHRAADRVPALPAPDREEALARLAARYAAGHGPVGPRDLAFWAGIPLTEARRALGGAGLVEVEVESETLWGPPSLLDAPLPPAPAVTALPPFDELVIGYADRRAVLGPHPLERIAPDRNGRFLPTVLVDGRLVATWSSGPPPAVRPLEPLEPPLAVRVDAVVAAQAGWSGR